MFTIYLSFCFCTCIYMLLFKIDIRALRIIARFARCQLDYLDSRGSSARVKKEICSPDLILQLFAPHRSTMRHSAQVRSALLHSTPHHTAPHHSSPLHSTPHRNTLHQSVPLHCAPLYSATCPATPLHIAPTHSASYRTPLQSAPHHSTPLFTARLHLASYFPILEKVNKSP